MSHPGAARIHSIPERGAGDHCIIALGLECDDCNRSLKFDPSVAVIGCGITVSFTVVPAAAPIAFTGGCDAGETRLWW